MKIEKKRTRKAFTIIELVIVIATIALLAGVVIKSATEKSRTAKMTTEVTSFVQKFMDGLVAYDNSPDNITGGWKYNIMERVANYIPGNNFSWAYGDHWTSMLEDPKTHCRIGAMKYYGKYRVMFYCPAYKGRSNDSETNKRIEVTAWNVIKRYGNISGTWGHIHGNPAYRLKDGRRVYDGNWQSSGGNDHDGQFYTDVTLGMTQ